MVLKGSCYELIAKCDSSSVSRAIHMSPTSRKSNFISLKTRWVAIAIAVTAIVWLVGQHEYGRSKGTAVPFPNVLFSISCACIAGFICKRFWIGLAVPFVAGIAGAFGTADTLSGPYGGVLGFLVGYMILLLPFGQRHLGIATHSADGADDGQAHRRT